ncbi:MAG: AAA family ATPase, partial [Gammaproteobacteria bacterium]
MDSPALHAGVFYFVTPALSQRLDLLRHLIEYSDRLVMVIAERGSGKSALCARLAETAADNWRIVQAQANPMVDSRILLRDIVAAFDVDVRGPDRQSTLDALARRMVVFEETAIVPVLLVDDAHELSGEALKLLFGLAQKGSSGRGLRTVLFCEPQIRTILDAPALAWLKNSVAHEIDLPGFDWVQTRQYLEELLSAGDSGLLPIDEHSARRIHQASHGLPGLIQDRYRELSSDPPADVATQVGVSPSKRAAPRHRWRVLTAAALMAVVTLYIVLDNADDDGPENASDNAAVPLGLPGTQPVDPAGAPAEVAPIRAGGALVPADRDDERQDYEDRIEASARAAGAAPPVREEAPAPPPVT